VDLYLWSDQSNRKVAQGLCAYRNPAGRGGAFGGATLYLTSLRWPSQFDPGAQSNDFNVVFTDGQAPGSVRCALYEFNPYAATTVFRQKGPPRST
jgi:hypothetical protein